MLSQLKFFLNFILIIFFTSGCIHGKMKKSDIPTEHRIKNSQNLQNFRKYEAYSLNEAYQLYVKSKPNFISSKRYFTEAI